MNTVGMVLWPLDPQLRVVRQGEDSAAGAVWLIHDPRSDRYFQLGRRQWEMFRRWSLGHSSRLMRAVERETGLRLEWEEVRRFGDFLRQHHLLRLQDADALAGLQRQSRRAHRWSWHRLLGAYFMFRLPLGSGDALFRWLASRCGWLFHPLWWRVLMLAGVAGAVGVGQRWELFQTTLQQALTPEQGGWFLLAWVLSKVAHESGHALAARRWGCRVGTVGVAFILLWPSPYTDVNDAWKLTSRRARLSIGAAGMAAEGAVAVMATWGWLLLPDGSLRGMLAVLAAVTWFSTLLVNLNPFMRFDGYYLLSDLIAVANLQERAFALGRWQIRQWVLALGVPPPEDFPPRWRHRLVLFAWLTWVYRLMLFLGLALLVYHLVFPLLGALLLGVEVGWLVLRPLGREGLAWWALRSRARWRWGNGLLAAGVLAGLLWSLWPTPQRVEFSAVLVPHQLTSVHPPRDGWVERFPWSEGDLVPAGAVLVLLRDPELEQRLRQLDLRLEDLRWRWD
ncbi:MAG: hypothetical protein H7831_06215, partial [Magnetococcus sp. WYHC-3]